MLCSVLSCISTEYKLRLSEKQAGYLPLIFIQPVGGLLINRGWHKAMSVVKINPVSLPMMVLHETPVALHFIVPKICGARKKYRRLQHWIIVGHKRLFHHPVLITIACTKSGKNLANACDPIPPPEKPQKITRVVSIR